MDTMRIRQLLDQRDEIDRDLVELVSGQPKRPHRCSTCNAAGHTSRNCPQKFQQADVLNASSIDGDASSGERQRPAMPMT